MLWILLVVVAVGAAGLLLRLRARQRGLETDLVGAELVASSLRGGGSPKRALDDAELRAQIAALVRNGRKIQAIKLLREHRPMPLGEAKAAVERADLSWHPHHRPETTVDTELLAEAGRLARQGRKVQAIKLVRERTGIGLREAKELVDRL